jgi:hypothetical protein
MVTARLKEYAVFGVQMQSTEFCPRFPILFFKAGLSIFMDPPEGHIIKIYAQPYRYKLLPYKTQAQKWELNPPS